MSRQGSRAQQAQTGIFWPNLMLMSRHDLADSTQAVRRPPASWWFRIELDTKLTITQADQLRTHIQEREFEEAADLVIKIRTDTRSNAVYEELIRAAFQVSKQQRGVAPTRDDVYVEVVEDYGSLYAEKAHVHVPIELDGETDELRTELQQDILKPARVRLRSKKTGRAQRVVDTALEDIERLSPEAK